MRPPLSYVPLLPVLAGIVSGVLLGRFLPGSVVIIVAAGLTLAAVAAILRKFWVMTVALAIPLAAVAASLSLPVQFAKPHADGTAITGTVTQAKLLPEKQSIVVEVFDSEHGNYDLLLTYPSFEPEVVPGDIVTFSGRYALPRYDVDLPLESDMSDYYFTHGISMLCYVPKTFLTVDGRSGNIFLTMKRWRHDIAGMISASALSEQASAFLTAILTGDSTLVSGTQREQFARAGVAHILALSGAHVALIAMVVSLVLFPLAMAGHRKWRWGITVAALWVFAIMTGLSPSVCRSVIMATAVLMALMLDRPRSSLNALCLAAILILLFNPMALFDIGFQLSFVATLSILLFSPRFAPAGARGSNWHWLLTACATTLAATLGTMPLVACHFHALPVYFLAANIVAVIIMPVMIAGGLLFVAALAMGLEPSWLVAALDAVYAAFDAVSDAVASLPRATAVGLYFNAWLLLPMYVALAFLLAFMHLRRPVYMLLTVATTTFIFGIIAVTAPDYADNEAYIVRSHRSTTIASHRGDTLLMTTTSPLHNHPSDIAEWTERYAGYISTRGIRHVEARPFGQEAFDNQGLMRFGRHTMSIALDKEYGCTVPHTYCLVTSGWYGDPVELCRRSHCDTIALSPDINSRRRNRYLRLLQAASLPVIDLSSRPLSSQ